MDRDDLMVLWNLRDSICKDTKELLKAERREQSAAEPSGSILRSLSKVKLPPDHQEQIMTMRERIIASQQEYLSTQAELEKQISMIPDQRIRFILSLHYVDLLTFAEVADVIGGGATEKAVQQLLARYFKKESTRHDDSRTE